MFEGIGCLATPYHISVDSSIQPVVCPLRNQPVALRERLKEELDYIIDNRIKGLETVYKFT